MFSLFCGALFTAGDRHHGREILIGLYGTDQVSPDLEIRAGSCSSAFRSAPT